MTTSYETEPVGETLGLTEGRILLLDDHPFVFSRATEVFGLLIQSKNVLESF